MNSINRHMGPVVAAGVLALAVQAAAQDPDEVRRLFEAGQYERVEAAAVPDAQPSVVYLAAQSHQKREGRDQALALYRRLANRPPSDPWHFVALSAQQVLEGQLDQAASSAQQAVKLAPALLEAHYQLGMAHAQRMAWREAAVAFEEATRLQPAHAYAHYYAGLMHSRSNRVDRMAIHFEQFLKLAPTAPERSEVLRIMRTVRGR